MYELGVVNRNIVRADEAAVDNSRSSARPRCTRRWAASA